MHISVIVFPLVYEALFLGVAPRVLKEAIKVLMNIGDWNLEEEWNFIMVSNSKVATHLLPKFVPKKLILQ